MVVLAEPDYMYGAGPLKLRIECVDRARPTAYEGDIWYRVVGVQIAGSGAELSRREVLVRGRRLPP